jgi:hypothetical protein
MLKTISSTDNVLDAVLLVKETNQQVASAVLFNATEVRWFFILYNEEGLQLSSTGSLIITQIFLYQLKCPLDNFSTALSGCSDQNHLPH